MIAAAFTVESDTCEHCQSGAAQGRGWDSLPHWHLWEITWSQGLQSPGKEERLEERETEEVEGKWRN